MPKPVQAYVYLSCLALAGLPGTVFAQGAGSTATPPPSTAAPGTTNPMLPAAGASTPAGDTMQSMAPETMKPHTGHAGTMGTTNYDTGSPTADLSNATAALKRHNAAAADSWIEHAEVQRLNARSTGSTSEAPTDMSSDPVVKALEDARAAIKARHWSDAEKQIDSATQAMGGNG